MITTTNAGSIKYDIQDNQFELQNHLDLTKRAQFNCDLVPPSSTVVLSLPSMSGTILVGANLVSGVVQLASSIGTITNASITPSSIIQLTYSFVGQTVDVTSIGSLFLISLSSGSCQIGSSHINDNNFVQFTIL